MKRLTAILASAAKNRCRANGTSTCATAARSTSSPRRRPTIQQTPDYNVTASVLNIPHKKKHKGAKRQKRQALRPAW